MIVIESQQSIDSVYIFVDKEGVSELIDYLSYVMKNDESMHLVIGSELNETPIIEGNSTIKHVKLVYLNSDGKE
jgi:hypothetical protein